MIPVVALVLANPPLDHASSTTACAASQTPSTKGDSR